MTYDQKMVVTRYIEEVMNTGNLERVADFVIAADVENENAHILGVRMTYPGLHVRVVSQIAEGEHVATPFIARATHAGSIWRDKINNNSVSIEGVNIDQIRDEKIVEHWSAANHLEALLEIGALAAHV